MEIDVASKATARVARFKEEHMIRTGSLLHGSRLVRSLALSLLAAVGLGVGSPRAAEAHERPTVVTSLEGHDLHVTVHGVTDYCANDADSKVMRTSSTIRIVRDRPSRASRCIGTQDLSIVVKDVDPGTYSVTYERIPLVAPARPLLIAWTTAVVR